MDERLCPSEEETRTFGREFAPRLRRGDVVLLFGELGSGKTVFVRGLAEGLGLDPSEVSSPTFALVHEYGPAGRPPVLVHADLYRLPDGSGLGDLGLSERGGAILAVEWPRTPLREMRAYRVTIEEVAAGARKIRIEAP
jgi:tRNA threonylcarbamoyladenosine biosynthesis protein TsaE